MGLKDWFAGKVAGPQSCGNVLGRHAREGGSALATAVFISHGSRPYGGQTIIFDTMFEMEQAGFDPRFDAMTEILEAKAEIDLASLTEDEQLLFKSLQTAMIAYAYIVVSNAALQNMRTDNASKFCNALGTSMQKSAVDCGLFDSIEAARTTLLSRTQWMESASTSTALNMDKPGSGDLLEHFIVRSVEVSKARPRYGFIRAGLTGFDVVAVPLVQETLKSIVGATLQYKW